MNYTSRYVRLFPVNFQNDEHELTSILEQINEISLCYYYWNSDHSYLDILYTSKHLIDYFLNDSVLEKFHYWEIGADEGYDHDTNTVAIHIKAQILKTNQNNTTSFNSWIGIK
ncbi:hypothetical protein HN014_21960 [Aquimarina sp. TRL1]|uniref:hypothetical protein n=1 Tax=Aquimarina sp. (strain TRL1) TaxID=2736252 RepID=UPI00158E3813|nr:hypothetical protein [Aquimarina sp. TRL1]QKX07469.1 hypothetical protein HN014_21960 [Aquimarina sp. TRL1]